jgi:hypothetical protein
LLSHLAHGVIHKQGYIWDMRQNMTQITYQVTNMNSYTISTNTETFPEDVSGFLIDMEPSDLWNNEPELATKKQDNFIPEDEQFSETPSTLSVLKLSRTNPVIKSVLRDEIVAEQKFLKVSKLAPIDLESVAFRVLANHTAGLYEARQKGWVTMTHSRSTKATRNYAETVCYTAIFSISLVLGTMILLNPKQSVANNDHQSFESREIEIRNNRALYLQGK